MINAPAVISCSCCHVDNYAYSYRFLCSHCCQNSYIIVLLRIHNVRITQNQCSTSLNFAKFRKVIRNTNANRTSYKIVRRHPTAPQDSRPDVNCDVPSHYIEPRARVRVQVCFTAIVMRTCWPSGEQIETSPFANATCARAPHTTCLAHFVTKKAQTHFFNNYLSNNQQK